MNNIKFFFIVVVFVLVGRDTWADNGLKDAMGKDCLIGVAINQNQSAGVESVPTPAEESPVQKM